MCGANAALGLQMTQPHITTIYTDMTSTPAQMKMTYIYTVSQKTTLMYQNITSMHINQFS